MNKLIVAAIAAGAMTLAGGYALAQMQPRPDMGQGHGGMMHGPGMMQGHATMQGGADKAGSAHGGASLPRGDQGPASLAYHGINAKMHAAMDFPFTGNADVDFVRGMIPHHEGAVDMAKVVIAFGKDPDIRKLAEAVIKAQEEEITFMRQWLERNGG